MIQKYLSCNEQPVVFWDKKLVLKSCSLHEYIGKIEFMPPLNQSLNQVYKFYFIFLILSTHVSTTIIITWKWKIIFTEFFLSLRST